MDELLGVLAHELAHVFRYRNRRRWKYWGRHDRAFWKLNQIIQDEWTAHCNKRPRTKKPSGKR
jgi:predicted SprT family Zn-dependent metalloprotease